MEEQFKKIWTKKDESELGEKHVPVVSVKEENGEIKIDVTIGSREHPSEIGHFIQWIELLDGDINLERIYLTHMTKPKVTFFIKEKPKKLIIREFCNLHGTWQYQES